MLLLKKSNYVNLSHSQKSALQVISHAPIVWEGVNIPTNNFGQVTHPIVRSLYSLNLIEFVKDSKYYSKMSLTEQGKIALEIVS